MSGNNYRVQCDEDGCEEHVESSTPIKADDLLMLGWRIGSHRDLCPEHNPREAS